MIVRSGSALVFAAVLMFAAAAKTTAVFAATSIATPAATSATTTAPAIASVAEVTDQPVARVVATPSVPATVPTGNPLTANPVATNPVVSSSPLSLASGLIFLLAMVLVAAWLVKRSGGMPSWRSGGSMKVVAALSVGPRERVLLIELGGQQWLLGVTPSAINNLHHFAEPIVAAGSAEDFSNKLRQLLPQGFGK